MADQIQYSVRWSIHDGRLDDFKALAAEASQLVEENEPNMLGYQWYLDADQQHCTLIEQYPSSERILTHLENVGPVLGRLLEVAAVGIDVHGEISDEARGALDPLGAVYHDHLVGFSRY